MPGKTNTKRGTLSAREATLKVLSNASEPLAGKTICERVRAMKGVKLGGKTPNATVAKEVSRLVQGGKVKRVERGTYALLEQAAPKATEKVDDKQKVHPPHPAAADDFDPIPEGIKGAKVIRRGNGSKKDEVKPDPKPTKQAKRSRRAKATA